MNTIQDALDNVMLDPKAHCSVNYVKARIAIEDAAKNREEKRRAKMLVVEHFNGTIIHKEPNKHNPDLARVFVVFPDNSRATF